MNAKDEFFKEVFESYFKNVLSELVPNAMKEAVFASMVTSRQEFVSISRATVGSRG